MLNWEEPVDVCTNMSSQCPAVQAINESIQPYLMAVNILEFNALGGNRHAIVKQFLTYNVINKRQPELNDLKHGMDEVSLIKFLRANPAEAISPIKSNAHIVFGY